jgi:hypothetical protein
MVEAGPCQPHYLHISYANTNTFFNMNKKNDLMPNTTFGKKEYFCIKLKAVLICVTIFQRFGNTLRGAGDL